MERHYKEHCSACVQDVFAMGWPIYCPNCEELNKEPGLWARFSSWERICWEAEMDAIIWLALLLLMLLVAGSGPSSRTGMYRPRPLPLPSRRLRARSSGDSK